ncbi:MAG: antibiotic ABC transporter ATP-binding protein [Bacteroidetes bacterium MED-G20]|nr:MAG: antibiotic ABC transporter ATP-binding protein [Bacteroidetes bacterium MED-G20]
MLLTKQMNKTASKSWDSKLFRRILGISKPHVSLLIYGVILTILLAFLSPLRPYIIGKLVGDYVRLSDEKSLLYGALLVVVILIIESVMLIAVSYISSDLGQRVVKDLRDQLFKHITKLKLKYFDQNPIGMLVTRSVSDMETIADIFSQGLLVILGDLLKLGGVLCFMFYINWKLTLIVLIPIPILIFSTNIFKKAIKTSFQEVRKQISSLNSFVQEHITGMNIVQIFSREDIESKKFSKINEAHKKAHIKGIMAYSIFFPVVETLSATSIALLVLFCVWSISYGGVDYGTVTTEMMSFILYISMLFRPIRMLADRFNTLQMGMVGSSRVFELIDREEFIFQKDNLRPDGFKGQIKFDNVHFSYNDTTPVFKGLSFTVNPGETVAIVGPTGAGKTSLINLISRYYEFQQGKITIDNFDIRNIDIGMLRSKIAVVLQDVFLFNTTILENITIGDLKISRKDVIQAAKKVGVHEFIIQLPGGYDFEVKERGGLLSSGQRQIIAFLRAYVYQPQLLILDEATSSIDSLSEEYIQNATEEITKSRTSIIIAHRLSTIQNADSILVMDDGVIVEKGNHMELLRKKGQYYELYQNQFISKSHIN